MQRTLMSGVAVLCLMAGGAFAAPADQPGRESPAPGTKSETMSAVKDETAHLVGTISAEMTTTTKGFVTAAAVSDMYEVAAGKIAAERGQSSDVKMFGKHMIESHTKTTEKLRGIISSDNIDVTPPAHVDDRRQGMLDDLSGAKASDFDHRYAVQQVAAHKEANILMRGYAKTGDNKDIKKFAATTDKAVREHLAMANNLLAANPAK